MSVTAPPGRILLGDEVVLAVSARLEPGEELLDPVPHPLVPPPDGVQFLTADSLRPSGDGAFTGSVRVAFYRLGLQPVPTLALLYRAGPGQPIDTLLHQPISVTIAGLAPAGSPTLKDIRPLAEAGPPAWAPLAILAGLILLAGLVLWRVAARTPRSKPTEQCLAIPTGPFSRALRQLDVLEAQSNGHSDGVQDLYVGVTTILRAALLDSGIVDSPGLTTSELRTALSAGNEAVSRVTQLLEAGDLVRFALVRPDRSTALEHLASARRLIQQWSESPGAKEKAADAAG